MAEIKNILIVCGEPSGDLLAANLAANIQKLSGGIKLCGVGGSHLAKTGADIFYNINGLSVMGLSDVLRKLPRFLKLKAIVLEQIKARKPDCLILVDFSGFNLRLAKAVNRRLPVIYYVSPQIWASREGRVNRIKRFISKIIVLFKFEEEFYRKHKIQADYAGHPLIDLVSTSPVSPQFFSDYGISPEKEVIALLPGSRKQEIKRILPLMLETARRIRQKFPQAQFIIAKSPNLELGFYRSECEKFNLDVKIVDGKTHDCLKAAQASLVCSGTATLEAAIIGKPFVIVYKTSLLNYLLYRPQIKIPYIGIVNIVAGRKIVPEFIQFQARPQMIAQEVIKLLQDSEAAGRMSQDLKAVKDSLGLPGSAERAAKLILEFLQNK